MKKKLLRVLAVILTVILLLTCVTSTVYGWWWPPPPTLEDGDLEMTYYCQGSCCCGPSSGVSIGRYYREEKGYSALPNDNDMYDELCECFPTYGDWTSPYNYGDGFDEMTDNNGYYQFNPVSYGAAFGGDELEDNDFWKIVDAIDNGWPVALVGNFWGVDEISGDPYGGKDWPPLWGHYIAIRGYSYMQYFWGGTYDYRIVCTDNYCKSSDLWLSWDGDAYGVDGVIEEGSDLTMITIKDNCIEDFEWGDDMQSLDDDPLGGVQWTVTKDGWSRAEIDTMTEHLGDKSAHFYYDGDPDGYNYVRAYYSDDSPPDYRGFWLRKDGDSIAHTTTGNGDYRLQVRVNNSEVLQYYDTTYHNVYQISRNTWYFIEFRNINWGTGTYDIYVDGDLKTSGAGMWVHSSYNGSTAFYGAYHEGDFWIDHILE